MLLYQKSTNFSFFQCDALSKLIFLVTLKEEPVIMGLPGTVQLGEDVLLNCTTQPAMPPANIVWYIDGRPDRVSTSGISEDFDTVIRILKVSLLSINHYQNFRRRMFTA